MSRNSIFVVFFFFLFSVTSSAYAQDDGQKQMENSVVKANQAFEAGQFLEAAEGYAEAFEFYKDYTLKKNEMIAWFKNGSCSPALEAADLYLNNGQNITESDRIDVKSVRVRCELVSAKKSLNLGNVETCESHLDKAEKIISADALPPVKGSDESREILEIRVEIEVLKKGANPTPPLPPEPETSYLGPILIGAGSVVTATGLTMIVLSLGAETDLQCNRNIENPSCDNPKEITKEEYESELQSIETLNVIGWVSTIVGVSTIGVGSFLWLDEGTVSASIDPLSGRVSGSMKARF